MRAWWVAGWKRDHGQSLVEYAVILALVAVSLVGVLILFRDSVGNSYGRMGNHVDAAGLRAGSPAGAGGEALPGQPGRASGKPGKGGHGCGDGQGGGYGRGGGCRGGHDR